MNSRVFGLIRKMAEEAGGVDGEELEEFLIPNGFVAEDDKGGSRVEVEGLLQDGRAFNSRGGCTGQGD